MSTTADLITDAIDRLTRAGQQALGRGDYKTSYECDAKAKLLSDRLGKISLPLPSRDIFVSYSRRESKAGGVGGAQFYDELERELKELELTPVVGFLDGADAGQRIVSEILKRLKSCSVFVGVLTREVELTIDGSKSWAPSGWLMEEHGMAVALGKPCVTAVDSCLALEYRSPTERQNHVLEFTETNYRAIAIELARAAKRHHQQAYQGLFNPGANG